MDSRLAVILVTYNGWSMTQDCLRRLVPQCRSTDRIIVVDNASQDSTPTQIPLEFPQVEIVALPTNMGFGSANNRGANLVSDCEILVFLNNDTQPEPGLIDALRTRMMELKSAGFEGVLSPSIQNRDGTEQKNYYSDISLGTFFCNAFRSESRAAKFLQRKPKPFEPFSNLEFCDWTSAICWCMWRSTWEKVGGFDPQIFMYYEDVDFAWRAKEQGVPFFLDTSLKLVHLGGGSAASSLSRSLQHDTAQSYVFQKRWGIRGRIVSWCFRLMRSGMRLVVLFPLSLIQTRCRIGLHVHWGLLKNLF